ncbi:MAG: arginine--tRNA ligase [Spirochaetaceae bacterium]
MRRDREYWKNAIAGAIAEVAKARGAELPQDYRELVSLEIPPRPELGDLAVPMFPFAKLLRDAPPRIAAAVVDAVGDDPRGTLEVAGPYVNLRLFRPAYASVVLTALFDGHALKTDSRAGRRIMVEFSAPNTNKPLHLGHLRNDALGESISRILDAAGAEVRKVNLINDRGIHICKSMLAYERFSGGATPESTGTKPDHFVGDYYVKFNQWAKENPEAEEQARELLQRWEEGDKEVVALWRTMNGWTMEGILATYERTGISFDKIYYESDLYQAGRTEVLRGLDEGVFYKDDKGTIWVDLEDIGLDKKVLLRGDGTSLYLTQDIGTAMTRYREWPFDQLVYVVGSEQRYHFTVLFSVLSRLGMEWADSLYHLAYGMVNLPEGKMKSREGTVVDADDLLDRLRDLALEEIREKERESLIENPETTAEAIALGALHYYVLQTSPGKDMIFDPKESLSFTGNTGPYLQYTGARISSMMRKYGEEVPAVDDIDPEVLREDDEWELVKLIGDFPDMLDQAAEGLNPSVLVGYLYEVGRVFSKYYHDHPIVTQEDRTLRAARVVLAEAVRRTLRRGLELSVIPFLEIM